MSEASILVEARLRLPDGREFTVTEHVTPEHLPSTKSYWTDGNMACDCNRKLYIDRQHGTDIDDGNCGDTIELVALTIGGKDALAPDYNDGDW